MVTLFDIPDADKVRLCAVPGCPNPVRSGTAELCHNHYSKTRRYGDPLGGLQAKRGQHSAFIKRAVAYRGDACQPWPFGRFSSGYGITYYQGKAIGAHRLICLLAYGDPPAPNAQAAHSCRCKPCVNPMHLRWATPAENNADKRKHGSAYRGSRHFAAKLDEAQVADIRRRLRTGETFVSIGRAFGVGAKQISRIYHGENWTHVTEESDNADL